MGRSHGILVVMNPYEQLTSSDRLTNAPHLSGERAEHSLSQASNDRHATPHQDRGEVRDLDQIVRILAMLQRQQSEQTHLLRQVLQEIETLKSTQQKQGTTVTKLDRRMHRARLWRLSWLLARIAFFVTIISLIVYLIGVQQIIALWERLVWLLT